MIMIVHLRSSFFSRILKRKKLEMNPGLLAWAKNYTESYKNAPAI